jgi:serine/threonine-protein kinase RsbW
MTSVLQGALTALEEHNWIAPEEEFYARLCLEEALVNAIKHGNRGDTERQVWIEMADEGDTCRISIGDEGQGFCCDAITVPDCHHKGGRGLCLIKHFMDEVEFDKARNRFEMAFRRKSLSKGG